VPAFVSAGAHATAARILYAVEVARLALTGATKTHRHNRQSDITIELLSVDIWPLPLTVARMIIPANTPFMNP
jgi:hypothetical protein